MTHSLSTAFLGIPSSPVPPSPKGCRRFSGSLASGGTGSPSPFERGEGWGEGSDSALPAEQKWRQRTDCRSETLFWLLRSARFFRSGRLFTSNDALLSFAGVCPFNLVSFFRLLRGGVSAPASLFCSLLFPSSFGRRWGNEHRRRGAALHADFEFGHHVSMQTQFHFMLSQGADRMFEMNLPFVEG